MNNFISPTSLPLITDLTNYLHAISLLENTIIIICVKDTIGANISENEYDLFQKLGLKQIILNKNPEIGFWKGYISFIHKDVIFEKFASYNESIEFNTRIEEINFSIFSSPFLSCNVASVTIDKVEYSENIRGLNFVIFDLINKIVIDSCAFDTHDKKRTLVRTNNPKNKSYELLNRNINEVRKNLLIDNIITNKNLYKKGKLDFFSLVVPISLTQLKLL